MIVVSEMDKTRDVGRGGGSRFSCGKRQISKQSDCGGGNVLFLEKSKKQRRKRLSVVGKVSSSNKQNPMDFVGSVGEDELLSTTITSKTIKLGRKLIDDCNTVGHTSVPRKLRTVMKKRNCRTLSRPIPDSTKLNHVTDRVGLSRGNGLKKPKLSSRQLRDLDGPLRESSAGSITKDEEEVVETLYALAVMFRNNENGEKTTSNGEILKEKSSALPELETYIPTVEDDENEDRLNSSGLTTASEGAPSSSYMEGLAHTNVVVKSSNEPSEPGVPNCKYMHSGSDNSAPKVNPRSISLLSKSEATDRKPSYGHVAFGVSSDLSLESGLEQPKYEEISACKGQSEMAAEVRNHLEQQDILNERKNKESHCIRTWGPSLQSSADSFPFWLTNGNSGVQPTLLEIDVSTKKDSRVEAKGKESWKRSTAHVHISRLIRVLQASEGIDRLSPQPTQTSHEGRKQGILLAAESTNEGRKGLSEVVCANKSVGSLTEKDSNEVQNAILLHKRLLHDQHRASSTSSGLCSLQKQSCDFLSLLAGGGGLETNNATYRGAGTDMDPPSQQFGVSYLQSVAHNQPVLPFSLPRSQYSSCLPDRLSGIGIQQVHQPLYLGNAPCGPHNMDMTASLKQQHQQQQIWAAQLAARYKSEGFALHYTPDMPSASHDSPSIVHYAQAIRQPSHSSMESLGPKYTPISQKQQLMSIASSMQPPRVIKQHHSYPFGYAGNGGVFYNDSASSLQLLCNEHP